MKRIKWVGNTKYQFCEEGESIPHFFFTCPAAKYTWSCIVRTIGATNRHASFSQFFSGGFPAFFLSVGTSRLQASRPSAEQFGNYETKLVSMQNLSNHL
jgi:hypothetical protein